MAWYCLSAAVGAAALISTAQAADGLTLELLTERAKFGVFYMIGVQRPDGLFDYEYDFLSGKFTGADNDVRQAGAAFAVAQYAGFFADASVAERAKAALAGLVAISVPFEDGAVVTKSGVAEKSSSGTTALALLAELTYFGATGDSQFEKGRAAWLRALLRLQRPSGGFAQAPGADAESDYYNGEAWLALAHYHQLFPDDAGVKAALAKADAYMMDRYGRDPNLQFAHWGLMAASVRYSTDGDRRALDFLAAVSEALLRPKVNPDSNSCYSIEGLAAAANVFSKENINAALVGRIVERAEQELAKSLEMQLLPGQTKIEFGVDRYLSAPDLGQFAGAFLNGRYNPRTRIDYTQHCLSAMMKYMTFKRSQKG